MLNITHVYGLLGRRPAPNSTETFAQRMRPTTVLVLVTVAYLIDQGHRSVTSAQVAERCGISPSTARAALARLTRAGWLEHRGRSASSRWLLDGV